MEGEGLLNQLVGMGFSTELAAEALTATGGTSIFPATEWLLSRHQHHKPPPPPTTTNNTNNQHQPKLDRFFSSHSKPTTPPPSFSQQQNKEVDDQEDPTLHFSKRTKLFHHHNKPLSERMRPRTLDEVVGQDHLLSSNSVLCSATRCSRLPSFILWGPPGTGKTSIARAIVNSIPPDSKADAFSYRFVSLSAVTSGVKDVRDAVEDARRLLKTSCKRTLLFVDEVHRFSKSQQDSFLPFIEDGSIVFVGATTENPSFHLITPLLSRCRLLTLTPLKLHHLAAILKRAVADTERGLLKSLGGGVVSVEVSDDAFQFLSENCDGDARVALNALEIAAITAYAQNDNVSEKDGVVVALDDVKEALQCKHLAYDRDGEEHYNLISALHKSMRGSDADAAIYWLARMLEGGEQPLYIARRLIRFSSEDVGLADPSALNQAVACYQACHFLGMPECNVILAQCVAYLALAPKSISVYRALGAAQKVVRESVGQNEGVPLHLRNAPTKLMKDLGYGEGYIYTPDDPTSTQSYLPPSLEGYKFLDWPISTNRPAMDHKAK